jgi:hypothetical protein
MLGMAISQIHKKHDLEKRKPKKIQLYLSVVGFLFMTLTIKYAIAVSSNLKEYYHHGIVFFSWTFAFIIFYGIWIHKIDQIAGNSKIFKYIKWLGKNVTAMYFIQWVFIGNIGTEVYKSVSNPYILVGSFMGILVLSSLVCFYYIKIKHSN